MSESSKTHPVVFVSYSHDSEEHRTWVRDFSSALRDVGVDVILDQWEIGPGDDVPKFMEQSVRRAVRVIMICTDQYVRKADDGRGGAGYEAMVVTGEVVADLGTRKFIPIVRQEPGGNPKLPACISTRYYVDFSQDNEFSGQLEELAMAIHEAPRFEKPKIGRNPFSESEARESESPTSVSEAPSLADPYSVYERSLEYSEAGNFAKWRGFIHTAKEEAAGSLLDWKSENQPNTPGKAEDLPAFFLPAVATQDGLLAAAFGAFDSSDERFHNQLSLLDWMRKPKGWDQSGETIWVAVPELIIFTYQALLGALALSRNRPEQAFRLATTPIVDRYSSRDSVPLFKQSRITGWPDSLAHTCTLAEDFLRRMVKEWEWLWKLYGSEEDALASIQAYYLFLNTIDFISAVKSMEVGETELRNMHSPLFFCTNDSDITARTRTIFFGFASFISESLSENGIDESALPELWSAWMRECGKWLSSVYRSPFGWNTSLIPHRDLPTLISRGSGKRLIE